MRRALDAAMVALVQEPEVRHQDLEAVIEAAPAKLAPALVDHGVAGLAHHHARHLRHQFPNLFAQLDAPRLEAWKNHRVKMSDLRLVAEALQSLAGNWAVVKGPVLVEAVYRRPDVRSYYDLDILVHPLRYREAMACLEQAGAVLDHRNWEILRADRPGQLTYIVGGRTPIDLHWHLVNHPRLRASTHWDMGAVLARAAVTDLGGLDVPTLEKVDALVHLNVHACLSGGHRLVWLKDIERQLAAFPVPFAAIQDRAVEAGVWDAVNLMLLRSSRALGFPGPPPTAWSRFDQLLGSGRFLASGGPGHASSVVAAATRRTARSSVTQTPRGFFRENVMPWARRYGLEAWSPSLSGYIERLQRPAGSEDDREAFFGVVAGEGQGSQ